MAGCDGAWGETEGTVGAWRVVDAKGNPQSTQHTSMPTQVESQETILITTYGSTGSVSDAETVRAPEDGLDYERMLELAKDCCREPIAFFKPRTSDLESYCSSTGSDSWSSEEV